MVWAGIAHGHKTDLIFINGALNAKRYRNSVLQPVVVPFVQRHDLTFQQDNARPRVAMICNGYRHANNVAVLPWPAFSPDLFHQLNIFGTSWTGLSGNVIQLRRQIVN
jgi:hypothetical protein